MERSAIFSGGLEQLEYSVRSWWSVLRRGTGWRGISPPCKERRGCRRSACSPTVALVMVTLQCSGHRCHSGHREGRCYRPPWDDPPPSRRCDTMQTGGCRRGLAVVDGQIPLAEGRTELQWDDGMMRMRAAPSPAPIASRKKGRTRDGLTTLASVDRCFLLSTHPIHPPPSTLFSSPPSHHSQHLPSMSEVLHAIAPLTAPDGAVDQRTI